MVNKQEPFDSLPKSPLGASTCSGFCCSHRKAGDKGAGVKAMAVGVEICVCTCGGVHCALFCR